MFTEVKMQTIKELRVSQNLTQFELAVKSNVSIGTIIRVEAGKPANRNTFIHLCEALGISPENVIRPQKSPRK